MKFTHLFSQVTDLITVQSDIEKLGQIMFGPKSPVQGFFKVKLSPIETLQRKISQRARVEELNHLSPIPRQPRSESYQDRMNCEERSELNDGQESDEESSSRSKKPSLSDFIPRFKGKGKNEGKQKGKVKFEDYDDDDNDDDDRKGLYEIKSN